MAMPRTTFRRAWSAAARTVGAAAGRHGFAEPDVILRWREVVGEALAAVCRPVKVTYGARRTGLGATLVVAAEGAHAPEVAHETPRIIDRVNRFYGYAAVSRVKVTQAAPAGFAEAPAPFAPEPSRVAVAREMAETLARPIADDDLRAALAALGTSILSGARPRGPRS